jgi:hypothetical protein
MVHKGRTLLSAECTVVDAENRVLIRTTATFMIVDAPRHIEGATAGRTD